MVPAAGITGFLVLGGGGDDGKPDAGPAGVDAVPPSASPGETRAGAEDGTAPLVPGWKTVVNPRRGIAFDVPARWALKSTGWVSCVAETGETVSWTLVGVRGVDDEVSEPTERKILSTVRLVDSTP